MPHPSFPRLSSLKSRWSHLFPPLSNRQSSSSPPFLFFNFYHDASNSQARMHFLGNFTRVRKKHKPKSWSWENLENSGLNRRAQMWKVVSQTSVWNDPLSWKNDSFFSCHVFSLSFVFLVWEGEDSLVFVLPREASLTWQCN